METENVNKVKRSELFNEILHIVKKINRVQTDSDAPDHPSVACELEQLFENKVDNIFSDIDKFYGWATNKCKADSTGNWQFITGGVIYNYSTKELYKDWKNSKLP